VTSAPTSSTAVGIPDAVTWPEVPGFIEGARGRIAEPFAGDCKVNFWERSFQCRDWGERNWNNRPSRRAVRCRQ
jgi:hypothetical protein